MHDFQEMLIPSQFVEAARLLRQVDLDMPEGISFGLGAYQDGKLVGTGFLAGNVVCGICVAVDSQGSGLAASLVSRLVTHALETGLRHLLLFTKPGEAAKFVDLGFTRLAITESAALLEWGQPDYADWLARTRALVEEHGSAADPAQNIGDARLLSASARCQERHAVAIPQSGSGAQGGCSSANGTESGNAEPFALGAVVVNANPFTLGHRFLVLQALERCRRVLVFVVEEDASVFPFADRIRLVQSGLADQAGVVVCSSGPYMVSRASFPSYFTGRADHSRVHAELDCTLFASRVAPDLGITARFVGQEPYCAVTAAYNAVMRQILPGHGIACVELPRSCENGTAVSASTVRSLLRKKGPEAAELEHLVPASTSAFLRSPQATGTIARLQSEQSRH